MDVYSPGELYTPTNDYAARLSASLVIPGNICVYGWTVSNTNAAAQYIFVFDANAVPGSGAIPAFWFNVAAAGDREFGYLPPREFNTGIVLANSSTNTSFTAGLADCLFDVQFDTLVVA